MPEVGIQNPQLEGDSFFWPAGPAGVLLIHGFTATTAEVRPLAEHLHGLGYTVSGPLLPGHHTTPADCNRHGWHSWVEAVEEAYAHLAGSCERTYIGGESAGGLLALYLAAEHPEAAGVMVYAAALKLALSRPAALLLRLLAPFVAYVPKGNLDGDDLWQGYPVNPLRGAAQLLDFQGVVRDRLARVSQPILIAQGRLDTTVDAGAPEMIYHGVSSTDKELHWFERSGHCVIIDVERTQAAELTASFLQRIACQKPAQ
jgi:carboxylesterase